MTAPATTYAIDDQVLTSWARSHSCRSQPALISVIIRWKRVLDDQPEVTRWMNPKWTNMTASARMR